MNKERKSNDDVVDKAINKNFVNLEVIDFVENPDGSISVTYETNEAFDKWYKQQTGAKRVTKKGMSKFIEERFAEAIKTLKANDMEFVEKTLTESKE